MMTMTTSNSRRVKPSLRWIGYRFTSLDLAGGCHLGVRRMAQRRALAVLSAVAARRELSARIFLTRRPIHRVHHKGKQIVTKTGDRLRNGSQMNAV